MPKQPEPTRQHGFQGDAGVMSPHLRRALLSYQVSRKAEAAAQFAYDDELASAQKRNPAPMMGTYRTWVTLQAATRHRKAIEQALLVVAMGEVVK